MVRTPTRRRNPKKRKQRQLRRRGGVATFVCGPNDGAMIIRGTGVVQVHRSRGEPAIGSASYWIYVLQWLMADTPAAAEIRETLSEEFQQDLASAVKAAREAAIHETCKAEATATVQEMIAAGNIREDQADKHVDDLVAKMVAEIEADAVAAETKRLEETAAAAADAEAEAAVEPGAEAEVAP